MDIGDKRSKRGPFPWTQRMMHSATTGIRLSVGEFLAHTYEPSFTFNSNKVSVNTVLHKKTAGYGFCADTRQNPG